MSVMEKTPAPPGSRCSVALSIGPSIDGQGVPTENQGSKALIRWLKMLDERQLLTVNDQFNSIDMLCLRRSCWSNQDTDL